VAPHKGQDGQWHPSEANFTSLATPDEVGSGNTALTTLMHEGGHAAHFANIEQGSPLFSQERAPFSVSLAETQSMFLDSLCGDAAWLGRYARDRSGSPVPWELLERSIREKHPYEVFMLRGMIAVPYFEKALYELPEAELTGENIARIADEIEVRIQGGLAGRPLLSVPHITSDESSCYYHGGGGCRVVGSRVFGIGLKGFEFQVLRFSLKAAWFDVWGLGSKGFRFRVQGSGVRVQGSGFRVQGSGFRVQGSGFRGQGSGFRGQGSEVRIKGGG
jgi:hypothetical protein